MLILVHINTTNKLIILLYNKLHLAYEPLHARAGDHRVFENSAGPHLHFKEPRRALSFNKVAPDPPRPPI